VVFPGVSPLGMLLLAMGVALGGVILLRRRAEA
jgi:hypothetical protein